MHEGDRASKAVAERGAATLQAVHWLCQTVTQPARSSFDRLTDSFVTSWRARRKPFQTSAIREIQVVELGVTYAHRNGLADVYRLIGVDALCIGFMQISTQVCTLAPFHILSKSVVDGILRTSRITYLSTGFSPSIFMPLCSTCRAASYSAIRAFLSSGSLPTT